MARVKIGNVRTPIDYLKQYFAPAGYGLGAAAVLLTSKDDVNTIKANGWYYWNADNKPANVPTSPSTGYLQAMRVWTTAGGTCIQELVDISGSTYQGCKMQRTIYGTTVFEWEWVNPPMMASYEFRTTERFRGLPVYTMLVECGTTVAGTTQKANPFEGLPIRYTACAGGVVSPYRPNDGDTYRFEVFVDGTNITLTVGSSEAGKPAYVQVWYTK